MKFLHLNYLVLPSFTLSPVFSLSRFTHPVNSLFLFLSYRYTFLNFSAELSKSAFGLKGKRFEIFFHPLLLFPWSKCIFRADLTSVVAPFYFIDLNHVPAPFSYSFSSSFSPHSIHMYFRLQPFFLVRSVEMHLRRSRLCWEIRRVE